MQESDPSYRPNSVDYCSKRLLPRERGGCAKNSENSGRSRIVRRKGIRAGDEEVVMCMTHRKEKEHDIEVQINSRKVYPAVKRGREVGK